MPLNDRERRRALKIAGEVLGDNPPVWDDMGLDTQNLKAEEFLGRLRASDNTIIADRVDREKEIFDILRTRTKTIRYNTRQKGAGQPPGPTAKSEPTGATPVTGGDSNPQPSGESQVDQQ
ncbi:MAG: hypothetical protein M4579_007482 [Chaenotheca gracillima]|nr:MAG: hypothetical protein M4579_007482 [Chaenotheca gracillima]